LPIPLRRSPRDADNPSVSTTVPGWYADPVDPSLLRWHDGARWTGYTSAAPASAAWRPVLGPGWFALSGWLQAVLATIAVIAVVDFVQMTRLRSMVASWQEDPLNVNLAEANQWDRMNMISGIGSLVLVLICATLFITWLYRAHRSAAMDPQQLRHDSGWAIGGWFVPILALWRPYQMVQDVRRGATRGQAGSALILVWWIGFLVWGALNRISTAAWPDDRTRPRDLLDQTSSAAAATMANAVATMVAAVLAILVVRLITRTVRTRLAAATATTTLVSGALS